MLSLQHVFLTGGCASFPQFKTRLEQELVSIRPFQSTFQIYTAQNPVLDSWYGARKFALSPSLSQMCITKQDYEEKGGEYLKEHMCSNPYCPTPVVASKTVEEPVTETVVSTQESTASDAAQNTTVDIEVS